MHHRLHNLRILRYTSHIGHGNLQISGHNCIQLVEQNLSFFDIAYPVGHHHHLRKILLESRMSVQCLQQRIGIRDGSRLRCGHQQHFPAGHQKFQHTVRDSRSGIHDNDIRQGIQLRQILYDTGQGIFSQIGHPGNSRTTRNKSHFHRAPGNDITDALALVNQITQVVLRYCSEHDLDVRQPEIRIQNDHPFAHFAELNCQIDGHIGFSHATLAGSNGNDSCSRSYLVICFNDP